MDEFDIFKARAYGAYVEPTTCNEDQQTELGLNGNVEEEWNRRNSSIAMERSTRRRSVRKSHDATPTEGESYRWADRSQSPGSRHERKGSVRNKINSHVTVAVEPPSPTETAREGHQRSQSWRTRHGKLRQDCDDFNDVMGVRYSPNATPTGLHRTRTMPARRSASPRQRSPVCQPVIIEPNEDSPTNPLAPDMTGECKIYRVRSFTTKKGGIVNRGDSIKVCNARRASRCDNLLSAPSTGSLSRRNSAESTGRGSLQPFQASPYQLRRNSESCLDASNQAPVRGPSLADEGPRAEAERRMSQSSRTSCRNIAFDDGGDDIPSGAMELIPGRRASAVRLQSPEEYSSNALWAGGDMNPHRLNGNAEMTDGVLHMATVSSRKLNDGGANEEEEEAGEDDGVAEEQVYNVMVIGSHGVGKTTLIHQLLTSEYLANKENYQADHDVGEKIVSVQLDDVESMVHFEDTSFSDEPIKESNDVDAYLVIYSVTDRSSFAYCQSCLQDIRKRRRQVAVMLVANKQDLVRNRLISEGEGKRLAAKRRCEFLEVSALLDHRVDEVLVTIIRLIRHHYGKALNGGGGGGGGGSGGGGRGGKCRTASSDDDLHTNRGCIHKAAAAIFRKLFK